MAEDSKTNQNDIQSPAEQPKKKQSFFGSFLKTVIVGDIKDIGKQLVTNVVVPRMKSTICDLIDQGSKGLIYGDTSYGKGGTKPRTEYNSIFEGRDTSNQVKVVPISSATNYTRNNAVGTYDTMGYNVISYGTREKAYSVLQQMRAEISQTGYVTVAKYYLYSERGELVNNNYTANYYGWRNLEEAYPYENSNGLWRISFPYNPIRIQMIK